MSYYTRVTLCLNCDEPIEKLHRQAIILAATDKDEAQPEEIIKAVPLLLRWAKAQNPSALRKPFKFITEHQCIFGERKG